MNSIVMDAGRLTFAARMLAHPSGSAFAESALRNAFAFLRRIYRFGGGFIETALPFSVTRDA